ncbi:MAG: Aminodeoxychorismate lyase (EC [uncultured Sulfurovum sp.]|uniref:Aminodeoxychorismate lyase (EC) n=1 Tax=uncultured Sulfurovum sp. TaxID=269237 RepID=A0A6S6TAX6_9BACT|nr:MAG: Aminodeoxychorismate lyase (EC [uncultured Sulfurovum sp.]
MLFETIKVEDAKVFNLTWHNQRFNHSRKKLFNSNTNLNLRDYIKAPKSGLYRCKIVYNDKIQSVEYFAYEAKKPQNFKVVQAELDYSHKYYDRVEIQKLFQQNYDEIIIEKNGLLTDTSIANIAFYNGQSWLTPKVPLLAGSTRARLLNEGFLKLHDIKKEDIENYSHFALMNAMIGFRIQKSVSIQI